VVHAGLDIALSELKDSPSRPLSPEMVSLLDDALNATESAVQILTNILELEDIEAGI
jgi:hypothetical protein